MPIRNANWYNLQSTRNYPLADDATCTADDGGRLPGFVLADCHLRWPGNLGRYAFLSGLTISPTLVTAILMAADDPDGAADFVPLAALTVLKPVDENRPYDLKPMAPGVGGYLVFGSVGDSCALRFSTPRQGLLASKCARPYVPLPVPTMRKLANPVGLQGLVSIIHGADLEIVREPTAIQGHGTKNALVIRLVQAIANRNVLQVYTGPCDKRPESHNCASEGVETINGVGPDCDGNLNIQIVGVSHGILDHCGSWDSGLVIEGRTGIDQVCATHGTPGYFQGSDYCHPSSQASEGTVYDVSLGSEPGVPWDPPEPIGSSEYIPTLWPVDVNFADNDDDGFEIAWGNFVFEDDKYASIDVSRRNVAVWNGILPGGSLDKYCKVQVTIAGDGAQRNGGLVANYHIVNPIRDPHAEYFLITIDQLLGAAVLYRFNGLSLIQEYKTSLGTIQSGDVYTIEVESLRQDAAHVVLDVHISGPHSTHFALTTTHWGEEDGTYGIGSDRSHALFTSFELRDRNA